MNPLRGQEAPEGQAVMNNARLHAWADAETGDSAAGITMSPSLIVPPNSPSRPLRDTSKQDLRMRQQRRIQNPFANNCLFPPLLPFFFFRSIAINLIPFLSFVSLYRASTQTHRVNTGSPVVFTINPPQCQMEVRRGFGTAGSRTSGPVTVGDPLTLLIHMKSEKGQPRDCGVEKKKPHLSLIHFCFPALLFSLDP
jgi:hypothetical protein